jgi:S1-C subfamily serine protease
MPADLRPSPNRLSLWLAGGLVLSLALAVGFWTGSTNRGVNPGKGILAGWDAGRASQTIDGPITASTSSFKGGRDDAEDTRPTYGAANPATLEEQDGESDSALCTALERLERRMAAGMERARESVVVLEYTAPDGPPGSRRIATGVVINSRGDVLSVRIDRPVAGPGNEAPAPIVARDSSGRRHFAQWLASDPETGLTLLRLAPRAVRPIEIAPAGPSLGSQIFVVGNPFGLGHSVSRGHIAGLDRALKLGSRQLGGLIQVQAPLHPGDSGAVVANLRGQLLALVRSGLAIPLASSGRTERDNDFGFAIPVRDLLWVADQLRARGRVDRAYLGVRLKPAIQAAASPAPAAEPGHELTNRGIATRQPAEDDLIEGAFLREVLPGTPAAVAGLRSGDAVVALDGRPIRSPSDLTDWLDRIPAQGTIRLDVVRGRGPDRHRLSLTLQTSSRPDAGFPTTRSTTIGDQRPSGPPQVAASAEAPSPGPSAPVGSTRPDPAVTVTPTASADAKTGPPPHGVDPVSIPRPSRSPLRTPVAPPQAEELKLTLPRVVTERLEELERRLQTLERQGLNARGPAESSTGRNP